MLIVPVGGMNALGLFDTNAQVDHERTRLIDLGLDYDLIVGAFIPCVLLALAVIVMPTRTSPPRRVWTAGFDTLFAKGRRSIGASASESGDRG